MEAVYDMCVNYDTLCEVEDKLQKVEYALDRSTEEMAKAFERSQGFLAGNQFEKAKNTTMNCLNITEKTSGNIRYARKYIAELREIMCDYIKCRYSEEV